MDESPKQLIEEIASTAMKPGQEARDDYEYLRHRMVNIFMPNEPLKETLFVEVTEFKIKKDWATFVKRISDEMYPQAKKIKSVMDNFKTYDASAFYEEFEPEEAKRIRDRFVASVFIFSRTKIVNFFVITSEGGRMPSTML